MCLLTLFGSIGLALGIGGATITTGAAAGTVVATTASVVAGAAVTAGVVGGIATAVVGGIQSARASERAAAQQKEYLKKLQENTGTLDVNKTATMVDNNSRIKRTLSSLRVGMLPQKQTSEEIVNNAYGVDSNNVVSSTQNMTGLNIAA